MWILSNLLMMINPFANIHILDDVRVVEAWIPMLRRDIVHVIQLELRRDSFILLAFGFF